MAEPPFEKAIFVETEYERGFREGKAQIKSVCDEVLDNVVAQEQRMDEHYIAGFEACREAAANLLEWTDTVPGSKAVELANAIRALPVKEQAER